MASSTFGSLDFLNMWGGNREACWAFGDATFDITVLCHAAQGVEVGQDEQLFVSLQAAQKANAKETRVAVGGEACQLKAMDIDTTLLICVWATRDEVSRRACGELRVPLQRLAMNFDGMLYQTWLTLDCPGLHDSVASSGLLDVDSGFDQKLVEGARQLFQPRICLSLCKASELPASGKHSLQMDAAKESRCSQWGPLLRSQQQHSVLSKALSLHASTAGESPDGVQQTTQTSQKLLEARARATAQLEEIERLRRELEDGSARLAEEKAAALRSVGAGAHVGGAGAGYTPPFREHGQVASAAREPGFEVELQGELERFQERGHDAEAAIGQTRHVRPTETELRGEVERLQEETNKVVSEANHKIEVANQLIRRTRLERDQARMEVERLHAEAQGLQEQEAELVAEVHQEADKKDKMSRLIEDVHQSSLTPMEDTGDGRHSGRMREVMDSIKRFHIG